MLAVVEIPHEQQCLDNCASFVTIHNVGYVVAVVTYFFKRSTDEISLKRSEVDKRSLVARTLLLAAKLDCCFGHKCTNPSWMSYPNHAL